MSPIVQTAMALGLGLVVWGAVRVGVPLSTKPPVGWGIEISVRDLVIRCMWVIVILLAAIPIWIGLADSPAYEQLLVPMLSGIACAEVLIGKIEKHQEKRKKARDEARRKARREKRKQEANPN